MTFVRYVLIQIAAYGIDMGCFLVLYMTGIIGPLWANVCAKIVAGLIAFVVHRRFTFRIREFDRTKRQALKYFALLALNTPLSSAVLAGLLHWLSNVTFAKIIADVLCVGLSYGLTKFVVFRGEPNTIELAATLEGDDRFQ